MTSKQQSRSAIKLPKLYHSFKSQLDKNDRTERKRASITPETLLKNLTAQAFGIYSLSMRPIVEYNTTVRREIASLTKMMNLFCCVRICKKFNVCLSKAYFRVTANAASVRGTTAELQPKQWVTVEDLFYGMMLPSGNDSATVLAENFGAFLYYDRRGQSLLLNDLKSLDLTEDTRNIKMYTDYFLKYMNATAKELGMKETVFVNPHGMDAVGRMEAYSIVEDLALLTKAMLDYPECQEAIAKVEHMGYMKTIAGKEVQVRKVLWQSTNKLLGSKGYLGGKTGQTNNAGNCLASLFKDEDNKQYIIIVLGCLTRELRFEQTTILINKFIEEGEK